MNSIHADHPLYQQIVKAVEVFTRARFTEPHTVEFQHKGSTLTLTWNSMDSKLLVEGQVSKYTSLAKGNVLKLNPTGSEHFAILLEVANMIPHLYLWVDRIGGVPTLL